MRWGTPWCRCLISQGMLWRTTPCWGSSRPHPYIFKYFFRYLKIIFNFSFIFRYVPWCLVPPALPLCLWWCWAGRTPSCCGCSSLRGRGEGGGGQHWVLVNLLALGECDYRSLGRGLQLLGLILYLIKLVCFGVIFSGAPALGFSSWRILFSDVAWRPWYDYD